MTRSTDALAALGRERLVAAGTNLVEEGDSGDSIFIVRSGRLSVEVARADGSNVLLGERSAGALVGELSALAGGTRSATLRAVDDVLVVEVDADVVRQFLEAEPAFAEEVSRAARNRLDRTALARSLESIVGSEHVALVPELVDVMTIITLEAGAVLFEPGDPSDAAYIVLSGRLLTSGVDLATTSLDTEIGRGETVGEVGLIEAAPRTHRVEALRSTVLARIELADFQQIISKQPTLMMRLFRFVLARATRPVVHRRGVGTIAVSVTAPTDRRHITTQIVNEIGRHGSVQLVSAGRVDAEIGVRGLADAAPSTPGVARVADLLHEYEMSNDHTVYEIDPAFPSWTERVVEHADRMVVITSATPDADERRRVQQLIDLSRRAKRSTTWVAHLHPRTATIAHSWISEPGTISQPDLVHEVHQLRERSASDLARLARLASGHGIGLVLGGGGARGFAHLGVVRALRDVGVPIDRVGGASIGSVMAALVAVDYDDAEAYRRVVSAFKKPLDYTVPIVSLTKGERIRALLEEHLGGWDAGHTWIPYFCVSTNLTHAKVVVHTEGELVRAIRSSLAIPGVIPPVAHGDDLLVDGGVLNNLPIDVFAEDSSIEHVIASDVAPPLGPKARSDFGLSVSGWSALTKKLRGGKEYPALTAVLLRSLLIGSSRDRSVFLDAGMADLYLDLDLRGVGLLEFDTVEPVERAGYEQAIDRIKEWKGSRCFS